MYNKPGAQNMKRKR